MLITKEIFQASLECETKLFLKVSSTLETDVEYRDWQRYIAQEFKRECSLYLCSNYRDDEYSLSVLLTEHENINIYKLVLDCVVQAKGFESCIDALERSVPSSETKHYPYIPIRFVPTEKVTKQDKLLLAFDSLVLSKLFGKMPQSGKIIHGSKRKVIKVKLDNLMKTVKTTVRKITAQQTNESPPPLILNKHCSECEFQSRCRGIAVEKDDLSLFPSMSLVERKGHQNKGIFTVTQLSYTFRPRRRSKHSPLKQEKFHHSLKALSIRENKIHIVGKPELKITGTPVYLDVEGVPDKDFYYLIGVRIKRDNLDLQYSFWANDITDEKTIWASFFQHLSEIENPQLIHYGHYETVFLKRMKERYGEVCENPFLLDSLISNSVNLLSVIYAQIYFPTYSNSLKEIARYMGYLWSDEKASGLNSLMWRSKWEHLRDPSLKQRLTTYNAEDCGAVERVANVISELCQRENEPLTLKNNNAVHTDSLRLKSSLRFGENKFSIPEMESINKAAYWSYQRSNVYVRTNKQLDRISQKTNKRQYKTPPSNTTAFSPTPLCCPECKSTSISKHYTNSKIIRDLKFSRTGIKRWIVRYKYHRYICRVCAITFKPQDQYQTRDKNGLNLLAYIVYQIIELRIPQITIAKSLNQLFDLQIGRGAVNRQKSRAAELYKDTYERILNKILNGKLIHADETKITIRCKSAYVWVLTNLEEVAYFYSDTREGEMVQSLLQDFKGVLVSDFYTAYDSINCPQQKCLIHLMRDLNDDLLKQPFNEEFKKLVQEFADLVKPMVDTIDKHGLKTHFLRKHKRFVERFYNKLLKADFKTEITVKYKKRFDKNRDRLFTFLDYDGVNLPRKSVEAVKSS